MISACTRTATILLPLVLNAALWAQLPGGQPTGAAHPGAAGWSVKGDGVVCCPCKVPCPCRTNAKPSYSHCEATLFLRIKQGHYGHVNLDDMNLVISEGMCAVNYNQADALYFSSSDSPERRAAVTTLMSRFGSAHSAPPHVEVVSLNAQVVEDHLFKVAIPGILEMVVDRNWGLSAAPFPMVAAPDIFSNQLQYAQNIRYRLHDPEAGLDFDYSRRQANYRVADVSDEQYRTKSMLIQYSDFSGWYSAGQMALIKAQHLQIPDLDALRERASRLKGARGSP
jgi:hypothetical protein